MTINEIKKNKMNKGCVTERIEVSVDQRIESLDEVITRKIVKDTDYVLSDITYKYLGHNVLNNTVILDVTAQAEKLGVAIDTVNVIKMNADMQIFGLISFMESKEGTEKAEDVFRQWVAESEIKLHKEDRLDNDSMEICLENGMYECSKTNTIVILSHSTEPIT